MPTGEKANYVSLWLKLSGTEKVKTAEQTPSPEESLPDTPDPKN